MTWCFEHLNAHDFQRVIGDLFYINVPMGGGPISARRALYPVFHDEVKQLARMSSLEEGLYQKVDDHDAEILESSFLKWLEVSEDEE